MAVKSMRHQVLSIQHSMLHSVLCTLSLSGRADRPRSAADGRDAHPYLEAEDIAAVGG